MPPHRQAELVARIAEACRPHSLRDLAEAVGCSTETIRRYVTGQTSPSTDFLHTLCQGHGYSAEWLLCGRGARTRSEATLEAARTLTAVELLQILGERIDQHRGSEGATVNVVYRNGRALPAGLSRTER